MRIYTFCCLFLLFNASIHHAQNAAFTPVNLSNTDGLPGISVSPTEITEVGTSLFALIPEPYTQDEGRLYKSDDNGLTWVKQANFLPNANEDHRIMYLESVGNNLAIFTLGFFTNANDKTVSYITGYLSTDNGATFDTVFYKQFLILDQNYDYVNMHGLDEADGKLFFYYTLDGVAQPQVYFSEDLGLSWTFATGTPSFGPIRKITGDLGVYSAIAGNRIYTANNPQFLGAANNVWTNASTAELLECVTIGNTQYFCTADGLVAQGNATLQGIQSVQLPFSINAALVANGFWYFNHGGHFYRAPLNDPGNLTDAGFTPMNTRSLWNVYHQNGRFALVGGRLLWLNDTPLESTDNGLSWQLATGGFPQRGGKLFALNQEYWLQHKDVLFHSPDALSWTLFQNPVGIQDGAFNNYNLEELQGSLFMTQIDYKGEIGNRVYRSNDNGVNWQLVWQGSEFPYLAVDTDNDRLFLELNSNVHQNALSSLYYSNNLGNTWTKVPGVTSYTAFAAKGDTLFYFQKPSLHYSYNLGQTWQTNPQNFNLPYGTQLNIFPNGTVLFVDKVDQIGYASIDGGQVFGQIFDLYNFGTVLNANNYKQVDSLLLAWGQDGIFLSANAGLNWIYISEGDWIHGMDPVIQDGFLYVGSSGNASYEGIPLRTPIQPLLDQLNLVSNVGGVAKGKVFYDLNGDCNAAFNDPARPNEVFTFQPGNYFCSSDATGAVNRILPPGTYTLQYSTPSYHDANCLAPQIAITGGNQTPYTLGFKPNQQVKDLVLSVVSTRARPGMPFHVTVKIKHQGTQAIAAGTQLNVNFPVPPILFTGAMPQASTQNPGLLKFQLPAIAPYSELTYKINFELPPDPGLMGQIFLLTAGLTGVFVDPTPANNVAMLAIEVFNSFDPNDKTAYTVSQTGQMPIANKSLRYLIRFQNTGTDTAFQVVIRDTLSQQLKWSTLQTIATSHPYRLVMTDQGVASWHFDRILLPDSTTNEAASHGFVLFSIQGKEGVHIGDTLRNKAAIYFDYNHPVFTNETSTPVVRRAIYRDEAAIQTDFEAEISPNPVQDQLYCRFVLPKDTRLSAWLCNAAGQQIRQFSTTTEFSAGEHWINHSMQDLPEGMYWLQLVYDGETRMLGVVKE